MVGEKMTDIKKNRLKYVLWAMIPFLVALYIHFSIYFPLDPFKLTPILIAKIFFIAIFSNAGLALITLNISKTYKGISTLLFIPSVTITPLIVGFYFIPAFFIMLILNMYFFIKLNPWKRNEMEPICT
jgi:hypothetical protein